MSQSVKFIDLFAGIGGFRHCFDELGCECVFSSEIDPKCRATYHENYGDVPCGDITKIDAKEIPDFDILCAGFPCQPFSICGLKNGFNDVRGTLFFDICRIVSEKKPSVLFLENVRHLVNHDSGNTLRTILEHLENLGYSVRYRVLNSKDFGVPQSRERIIIIATKEGVFNFDSIKHAPAKKIRDILDTSGDFEILDKSAYTLIDPKYVKEQASGLIFRGYRNKGTWKNGVRPNTEHLSRVHRQPNRIYSVDGVHPTLPSQESSGRFWIYDERTDVARKLTINECYKLMGFPEDFKRTALDSDSYRQLGNSVVIPMIMEVAKEILNQCFMGRKFGTKHARKTQSRTNIQLSLFPE